MHFPVAPQEELTLDGPLLFEAEQNEVVDREVVEVGRFIPDVGEESRLWRAATEQVGKTHGPVSKIRKGDDGVSGHSEDGAQHTQGIAQLLDRLAENAEIEGTVGVVGQALLEIPLIDRDAAGDRSLHLVAIDLDTAGVDAFVIAQPS